LAVHEHQHPLVAQALEHDAGAGRMAAIELDPGLLGQRGSQVRCAGGLDTLPGDDLGGYRDVREALLPSRGGHHELVERKGPGHQPQDDVDRVAAHQ
jgi:hypothetical protein